MPTVKYLRRIGQHQENSVVDVDGSTADYLIGQGAAELVTAPAEHDDEPLTEGPHDEHDEQDDEQAPDQEAHSTSTTTDTAAPRPARGRRR